MIDLIASTVTDDVPQDSIAAFKRAAFLAILEEEEIAGRCGTRLLDTIKGEVRERMG